MTSIMLAYLIIGVVAVLLDLRQPMWNRPAYLSRGAFARILVIVAWLPLMIGSALWLRISPLPKDLALLAAFAAITIALRY